MKSMQPEEFVRRLRAMTNDDFLRGKFAFFLGAGCSIGSGILGSEALVRELWLPELYRLRNPKDVELTKWSENEYGVTLSDFPTGTYGRVMLDLFPLPTQRQLVMENLCRQAKPGFAYATMAQLIASSEDRLNFLLTTNFDDLLADAFYLFTDQRPTVISHGSLSPHIRATSSRPLIVKLHGHHQFNPLNTLEETQALDGGLCDGVRTILRDRGLIFLGYGGRDSGIRDLIASLSPESLPFGVFWFGRQEPNNELTDWLDGVGAFWVPEGDFDATMVRIKDEFGIQSPDRNAMTAVFDDIDRSYVEISNRIQLLPADSASTKSLREAAARVDETVTDWAIYELRAKRLTGTDPEGAKSTYEEGLTALPDSVPLHGNYANLLKDLGEYDLAQQHYEIAIGLAPQFPNVLHDYAIFLWRYIGDQERAEEFMQRAMRTGTVVPLHLSNFGNYVWEVHKDILQAYDYFRRAVSIPGNSPEPYRQFALFAHLELRNYELADSLYHHAQTLAPGDVATLVNRAALATQLGDRDAANNLFERALAASENDVGVLGNAAVFYWQQLRDLVRAKDLFERALACSIRSFREGNYRKLALIRFAQFLAKEEANQVRAKALLDEAQKIDPADPDTIAAIAHFAAFHLQEPDRACSILSDALESAPGNPVLLATQATVLEAKAEFAKAEKLYREALNLDENLPGVLANLGGLLVADGRTEEGIAHCRRALLLSGMSAPDIAVECFFNLYAHANKSERAHWLGLVKLVIERGGRSIGWDLNLSTERAILNGFPEPDWIRILAKVVVGKEDAAALNEWAEWKTAQAPIPKDISESPDSNLASVLFK